MAGKLAVSGAEEMEEEGGMGAKKILDEKRNWEKRCLKKAPERIESTSGMDINIVYSPAEIPDFNYLTDIGFPGEYPFTRGIQLSRSQ